MPEIVRKASLIVMLLACMAALLYEVQALGFGRSNAFFGAYACLVLSQGVILSLFGLTPELFADPVPPRTYECSVTLSGMLLLCAYLPAYFGHVFFAPGG